MRDREILGMIKGRIPLRMLFYPYFFGWEIWFECFGARKHMQSHYWSYWYNCTWRFCYVWSVTSHICFCSYYENLLGKDELFLWNLFLHYASQLYTNINRLLSTAVLLRTALFVCKSQHIMIFENLYGVIKFFMGTQQAFSHVLFESQHI